MSLYQLIFTDGTGHIILAEDHECAEDQSAVRHARALLKGRRYVNEVEIWDKTRLIGKSRRSTWADASGANATLH
jgi:hypothetical protein